MKILDSPLTILGLLTELFCALTGVLLLLGVFSLSKVIPAKHVLNRQAGKGILFIFGAALSFNLISTYSSDWNGWLAFLASALCIFACFIGLRIIMPAMKEINKIARQGINIPD